ncbi:MAG TPA: hypothetical protein EYG21_02515 [Nitrospinaceae bacterium]|nr:hypothetical protein [Nitrospinaceae bacterium]
MFGILEKMDKFSNEKMTNEEKISFTQEVINNGLVWDMHQKYIAQASEYLNGGQCHYAFMENMVNPVKSEAVK